MPWTEHRLRGQIVLAKVDADGRLVVSGGRVEVRYKPNDGRAYQANPKNLERPSTAATYDDDHCAPAERPADKTARETASHGPGPAHHTDAKAAGARSGPSKGPRSKGPSSTHSASTAEVVVYADGACTGNPGPAGLGVVIQADGKVKELSEYLGHGTNNIGELTAVLRAAEALADEKRSIEIKTDSKYAIGVLTMGWKAKANQALIHEVKAALSRLPKVRVTYVAGHAGIPGNERADELARGAVSRRASRPWTS